MLNENIEDFMRTGRDLLVEGLVEGGHPEVHAVDESDSENGDFNDPEEIVTEAFINLDTGNKEKDVYKENVLENSPSNLTIPDIRQIKHTQVDGLNAIIPTNDEKKFNSEKQEGKIIFQDQSEYTRTGNDYVKRDVLMKYVIEMQGSTKHACIHCDYTSSNKSNLRDHRKRMHEAKQYKCDECDYKASVYYMLKRHIDSQHAGIRYDCEECGYTVRRKSSLTRHFNQEHVNVI